VFLQWRWVILIPLEQNPLLQSGMANFTLLHILMFHEERD
jgi:hypothetical protein